MKLNIIILITILSVIISCKKEKNTIDNEQVYITIPIDSKVIINPIEYLNDKGNNFEIFCYTEKIYGARCFRIVGDFSFTDSIINIEFKGVSYPANLGCSDSPGPAWYRAELEVFPVKNYTLNIYLYNQQIKGTIIVSDTNYVLHLDSNEYVDIDRNQLNRMHPNTIWGYIHSYNVQFDYVISSFMDSLKALGAVEKKYPIGEYTYFFINNQHQIFSYDIIPEEYFLYELANANEVLPDLVTWVRKEFNPSGISGSHKGYVMIYDSFGNSY